MAGNTFGKMFTVTTCGESHGPAYLCIVDGCPPGMDLCEDDIQVEMDKRKPGQSKFTTLRNEKDQVKIISGVFSGKTTGVPIGLMIENLDQRSVDYSEVKDKFRPGHGDYTYLKKYGLRDYRGSGRASARETAMRVAAGAIAKKYLRENYGIEVVAYVKQIGPIVAHNIDLAHINSNPFFCADASIVSELEKFIEDLREAGDSIGARVDVEARNVPAGIGDPVFDRLDADVAKALMSINAVKAVEIGQGFECVTKKGSEHRDEMTPDSGFTSNNAGGILAGISTGQTIKASIAFKPASSILVPGRSVDIYGNQVEVVTKGRHDPCVGIRGVPVASAMVALVIMDHILRSGAYEYDRNKRSVQKSMNDNGGVM